MARTVPSNTDTTTQTRKGGQFLKWVLIVFGGAVLVAAALFAWMMYRMNYVPGDLNTSTALSSEQGLFNFSYTPQNDAIRINRIHSWTLHVEDAAGAPVENAVIAVDGDMPQHGHGLSTSPRVTKYLGNGDYQVDGLKFHMPGWWIVEFEIEAGGQKDQVTFNLLLNE